MRKGTYLAILFSLVIHGIILFLILLSQTNKPKIVLPATKKPPIQSFIYYPPNLAKTKLNKINKMALKEVKPVDIIRSENKAPNNDKPHTEPALKSTDKSTKYSPIASTEITTTDEIALPKTSTKMSTPEPLPVPENKRLDSFTQLQRLRSKLNQHSAPDIDNPYQNDQPPSIFNSNTKSVPHSVPLKDEEKEREKNTKNMGAGIAITKGDDGRCSVTQDLSVYGLSEGSSTQFFSCGETKFDKNFREHMKKVNAKLGKN